MKNYCTLGKCFTKWIALEEPIEGSMSSLRATEMCMDNPDTKWADPLSFTFSITFRWFMSFKRWCTLFIV
jgi:hypothetical protein